MKLREEGFSLLEVMIAITLFAFFMTAFLASQGYNVSDSALSEEQLTLQSLCEKKINELYLNPPNFTGMPELTKETKNFEEKELSNYNYTIEIKKLLIPDFGQLFTQKGGGGGESEDAIESDYMNQNANRNQGVEKLVFEELKKNIEKLIWQARITVTNKETNYSYTLSTYLTNANEKIQLNIGF